MSNSKTGNIAINHVEKQRQALELRKSGATFEQIAQSLGYANHTGAYKAVKAAMRATIQQPADELRALEAARLDRLLLGIWQDATKGQVLKIDRVLKIMSRRAALFGLDAPTKTEDVTDRKAQAATIAATLGLSAEDAAALAADADRLIEQRVQRSPQGGPR